MPPNFSRPITLPPKYTVSLCTYHAQTLITSFLGYRSHLPSFPSVFSKPSWLTFKCCYFQHVTPIFRKLHWLPVFHHIKSNLFCLTLNTLSNLSHISYPASFPTLFGPFFLIYLSQSVSQTHHTPSTLHLWYCYLLHSKSPPPLSIPTQILPFFQDCASFSYFKFYCLAANSQVIFKLANLWTKIYIVFYIIHCFVFTDDVNSLNIKIISDS